MLNRQQILELDDLPKVKVPTPEWGQDGFVWVRCMNGTERYAFFDLKDSLKDEEKPFWWVYLLVFTICDEAGNLLFVREDMQALAKKHPKALNRIYATALKINAIGDEAEEAVEKNSGPAQSAS